MAIRPAGMLALDVARIEAGLILVEVDFDSVRRALIPEQSFSPFELGILGRFVDFEKQAEFVGRRALEREQQRGGPPRRLVGLELEWESLEGLYRAKGLMPTLEPAASREPLPLYARGRQVGKATSTTWSPILKKVVALASVRADHSALGSKIEIEWTVEARRHRDAREGRGAAVLQPDAQDLDAVAPGPHMSTLILRGGVEIEDPLGLALEFLEKYPSYETYDPSRPASFAESDLKRANRGGARISASRDRSDSGASDGDRTCLACNRLQRVLGRRNELDPVDPADATLRLLRRHPRSRLLEDDKGPAPEAPGADPNARQRRPGIPGRGRSGATLVGVVRRARDRARPQLQRRARSQPLRPARDSATTRAPRASPHRGANPRHGDLVRVSEKPTAVRES